MSRDSLVGSRIRERRVMQGIRQADLAATAGISASYLNLIEHNKRRIGGKLLVDIATALEVEPSLLSEGAEAALIAILREASAEGASAEAELERTDEFAGRFPGWARLVAERHKQVQNLSRVVEALTDRLSHDPHLATSMHELLSMVAAIRSTAGILHDNTEIEPEWQGRFHRNLNEDSKRLAESAKSLVGYFEVDGEAAPIGGSPQDELDAFLKENDYHFPTLEQPGAWPDQIIDQAPSLVSVAARGMARRYLETYQRDAHKVPKRAFLEAVSNIGLYPAQLARRFDVSLTVAMRRCAAMPWDDMPMPVGLVVSDGAGSLLIRREIEGFAIPRFSSACAKWPLFQAMSQPMTPIRSIVEVAGHEEQHYECLAYAESVRPLSFRKEPLYQASMLILPLPSRESEVASIGTTCRICPSEDCDARSMPSILSEGI